MPRLRNWWRPPSARMAHWRRSPMPRRVLPRHPSRGWAAASRALGILKGHHMLAVLADDCRPWLAQNFVHAVPCKCRTAGCGPAYLLASKGYIFVHWLPALTSSGTPPAHAAHVAWLQASMLQPGQHVSLLVLPAWRMRRHAFRRSSLCPWLRQLRSRRRRTPQSQLSRRTLPPCQAS